MISYKTFLMIAENSDTYTKLVDIKDFPDLFAVPEKLEKTTLSDRGHVYDEGIEANDPLEFTANYTKTDFDKLRAMKGEEKNFAIWFGGTENGDPTTPTGSDGKYKCKGKLNVSIVGKGVNEVLEMKISITPSTALTEDNAAS